MKDEILSRIVKFGGLGILLCVVVWSFYIVGSPQFNRELRIDQQRLQDVYYVKRATDLFYKHKGSLPTSLDILIHEAVMQSDQEYRYNSDERQLASALQLLLRTSEREFFSIEYKVTGTRSYNVCTSFFHAWEERESYRNRWEHSEKTQWKHPSGRHCFNFEVNS